MGARGRCGAVLAALACALVVAPGAAATQEEYERAYELGLDAYRYGLPAVALDRTFREQTSVDKPVVGGFAPPNRFSHAPGLARPENRTVVAPNHDTLYSIAWLDLRRQPMVITVPRVRDRYFVLPLMDPWSEDFHDLGSVDRTKPGDYVVTGPGQHRVDLPPGTRRIKSRYDRIWIVGRTATTATKRDVRRAVAIEHRYELTPLSKYGKPGWKPRVPRRPDTKPDEVALPAGLAFFDRLGRLLERFRPPRADAPELARLAAVGIGPGMRPSRDPALSADTLRGLADAAAAAPDVILDDVRTAYLAGFGAHNGWLVLRTGTYGTDYVRRAATAQVGLGATVPEQAIYPAAQVDSQAQPLTGAKRYVMHFEPGQLPPARAFWSVTMYDLDGFFVLNPIDRYLVNDSSDLEFNPDGSLDVFVQAEQPADPGQARNWLPAPPGEFRLIMRIYAPPRDRIAGILDGSGWAPPTITPVP